MKKNLIIRCISGAIALSALGACADSEPMPKGEEYGRNAIRFAVNTEFVRSGDITTNNLNSFNVYAYVGKGTDPKLFMDNVAVTKTSTNTWTYSPVAYWPADDTVDFYAYAPAGWVKGTKPFGAIEYESLPGTEDIVYAVVPNMKGNVGTANAQVLFNFRHALSKVTVKMSSTNTNLKVMVSSVSIDNIMTKGSFRFPNISTSGTPDANTSGTWSDQNTPQDYSLYNATDKTELITLTSTATDVGSTSLGVSGARFLIPQILTWRSNGNGMDSYLAVTCSIFDTKTGSRLWPNENTPSQNIVEGSAYGDGILKFPLSTSKFSEWNPGTHYLYNLVINSNDEMGPIEFGNPTVDTFVEVESIYQ